MTSLGLHRFLDFDYGADGDTVLRTRLERGEGPDGRDQDSGETALHVATRRRRVTAVTILLDHGAEIEAKTAGGKTAYAHAVRRGFDDVVAVLVARGAQTALPAPDRLAVAVVQGDLKEARRQIAARPSIVCTGNPEEDRLLADVAGREGTAPVALLIEAGADLTGPALDGGTPLHQAAWFGQPANARLLIDAGAPLEVFDGVHASSPLGWVVHGSRYSGGAEERQEAYVTLAHMLLDAGASLQYPGEPAGDAYRRRLLETASPAVADVLRGQR